MSTSKLRFIMSIEVDALYEIYLKTFWEVEPDYPATPLTLDDLLDPTVRINDNLIPVFYRYLMDHFKELIIKEYEDTDRSGLIGIALNEDWLEPNGVELPLVGLFDSPIENVPLKVSYDIAQ